MNSIAPIGVPSTAVPASLPKPNIDGLVAKMDKLRDIFPSPGGSIRFDISPETKADSNLVYAFVNKKGEEAYIGSAARGSSNDLNKRLHKYSSRIRCSLQKQTSKKPARKIERALFQNPSDFKVGIVARLNGLTERELLNTEGDLVEQYRPNLNVRDPKTEPLRTKRALDDSSEPHPKKIKATPSLTPIS